jgi:gas vesicle protein
MNNESSNTSTILLAFAGGALLGAGLALLFSPQPGRKTRRQLGDLAEGMEDYTEDLAEQAAQGLKMARQKGSQWIEKAQELVELKKNEVAAAIDIARR